MAESPSSGYAEWAILPVAATSYRSAPFEPKASLLPVGSPLTIYRDTAEPIERGHQTGHREQRAERMMAVDGGEGRVGRGRERQLRDQINRLAADPIRERASQRAEHQQACAGHRRRPHRYAGR